MKEKGARWPVKTREFRNRLMDSTVWNDFRFRDDDIIIASYMKSGTTWVQQIVRQLIFNIEEEGLELRKISPWLDRDIHLKENLEALEAQTHRRFIKTHLPADTLVFSPKAKYIFIARDGRDIVWSWHPFFCNMIDEEVIPECDDYPPVERPSESVRQYFNTWLDMGGCEAHPFFWEHVKSWWNLRDLPNVMLLHFNDLKRDMSGHIRRIAEFLNIPIDETRWETVLEHCRFEYMKKHADKISPAGPSQAFFHKGTDGRWKDMLTHEESRRYEDRARERLGEDCAYWLQTGKFVK